MILKSTLSIWTINQSFVMSNSIMNDGLSYFYNRIFKNGPFQDLYLGLISYDGYQDKYNWQALGYYNPWTYLIASPGATQSPDIDYYFTQLVNVQGLFLTPAMNNQQVYTTMIFPSYVKTDRLTARYQMYV